MIHEEPRTGGRSRSPRQETRFAKEKAVINYDAGRPPREGISTQTSRVLPAVQRRVGRLWMMDSGASHDIIGRQHLSEAGHATSMNPAAPK